MIDCHSPDYQVHSSQGNDCSSALAAEMAALPPSAAVTGGASVLPLLADFVDL